MTDSMRQVELLRAACCVAGVDGEVTEVERKFIQRLADRAGVGAASLTAMIERAESDPNFYDEQFHILKFDPKETMQELFRIAAVDGQLEKAEAQVLQRLAHRLGIPKQTVAGWIEQTAQFLQQRRPDGDQP